MTYSFKITQPNHRARALQQNATACVTAALVDAMGDLADWSLTQRNNEQTLLIRDLGLRTAGTTLEKAGKKARRRYGSIFEFQYGSVTFAQAVQNSIQYGVVIGLASNHPERPGHAYHLLGGSFPLRDHNMPSFIQAQLQATDNLLEQLQLWDPWDGLVSECRYGEVYDRYERAGAMILRVERLR